MSVIVKLSPTCALNSLTTQLTIDGQYLIWLDNGGSTSYPLLALEKTKVSGTTTIDG
ncbi:hypothetical protein [uncultured Paraglaciecola sp.]|uniref:hypothetical protein n=1 Tax=uncultured Paraglaciecola sp. TaxID=1765024 RepID=UPI0025D15A49|nr:hypothetical protein [uncultured Paraglaciecola sp.]